MSIFSKAFKVLATFFKNFFKNLANGDQAAADQIQLTVEQSTLLVNNIKAYLESPVGDIVVKVIPGEWDDELKVKGTDFLTKVIAQEATLHGCFELPTMGEQIACVYSKIIGLNDENQNRSFFHKLGVLATAVFAGGKLTFSDAILAAEMVYRLVIKEKKIPAIAA